MKATKKGLSGLAEVESTIANKVIDETRERHTEEKAPAMYSSVAEMGEELNVYHIEKKSPFTWAALLDLDSCMLDFFKVFLPIIEKETGKKIPINDFYTFDLTELYDISKEEVLRILSESNYMLEMEAFEYTKEFIQWLRDQDLRIVFSTSRTFAPHCYNHTLKNLRTLGLDFDELHLVSGVKWRHKPNGITHYQVYVDDAPYHLENFFAGKRACDADVPTFMIAPVIPYNTQWHLRYKDELGRIDLATRHYPYFSGGEYFTLEPKGI